jgi:hypothetical protein
MGCCDQYTFPFSNSSTTSISYSNELRAQLGSYPKVSVYYFDDAAQNYYLVNGIPSSQIKMIGNVLQIDHGGIATGIIRLS